MMESRLLARYAVIPTRRSWRRYDPARPVPPELLDAVRRACEEFRPFAHARSVLVTETTDGVFKGVIGPYGKIRNAPAFVAFVGDMTSPYVQEETGYTGEGIVLEATALGLDTCWVGGFFRPDVAGRLAGTGENERVLAVTPVGYRVRDAGFEERAMAGFGSHSGREPLEKMLTGLPESQWPEWVRPALGAARLAPSAVNRQPWGFEVAPDAITVFVRKSGGTDWGVSRRLDCGIAMLHLELGAAMKGTRGRWEFLAGPQVARFVV